MLMNAPMPRVPMGERVPISSTTTHVNVHQDTLATTVMMVSYYNSQVRVDVSNLVLTNRQFHSDSDIITYILKPF